MSISSALGSFGVEGFGLIRVPLSEIAELRKNPGPSESGHFAPLLRHADEQSVLAVAAVLRAIDRFGWRNRPFDDWAVLAAPRYLGRVRIATCCEKFRRVGVRGVPPWIIPNQSLHAVAGTVTMVLRSHGPNFGVGGSVGHLAEAFEVVLPLLQGQASPGAWLVLTEWSPEPIIDENGQVTNEPIGHGVALALSTARNECPFVIARRAVRLASPRTEPSLDELSRFLTGGLDRETWSCPLTDGIVEIHRQDAAIRRAADRLAG